MEYILKPTETFIYNSINGTYQELKDYDTKSKTFQFSNNVSYFDKSYSCNDIKDKLENTEISFFYKDQDGYLNEIKNPILLNEEVNHLFQIMYNEDSTLDPGDNFENLSTYNDAFNKLGYNLEYDLAGEFVGLNKLEIENDFDVSKEYFENDLIDSIKDDILFENKDLEITFENNDGTVQNYNLGKQSMIKEDSLEEIDQVLINDISVESENLNKDLILDLNSEEPVVITFENNDGTLNSFTIKQDKDISNSESISESAVPVIKQDENQKTLAEIKEYIEKNKDKIKNVNVKNGANYNKTLSLKDIIDKELTTINHTSSPDKLADDILMSLIKPFKIYDAYVSQKQNGSLKPELNTSINKQNLDIKINNDVYTLKDYKDNGLIVIEKDNIKHVTSSETNYKILANPDIKFNSAELFHLNKGTNFLIREIDGIPLKAMMNDKKELEFFSLTQNEFSAYSTNENKQDVSVKESKKLNTNL